MKCARCEAARSGNRWTVQVCADKRRKRVRYLCDRHDAELNLMVLQFFRDPHAEPKVKDYAPEFTRPAYSLDADPDSIRARVAECIAGALEQGAKGVNRPPRGHWLIPFWLQARAEAALAALSEQPEARQPDGYAYRYPSGYGSGETVIRFTCGQEINGVRPIEAVPYFYGTPPGEQPEAQGGGEEIVGHKTFNDGHGGFRHEPLTRAEADALIAHCKSEDERRKALMPDERSAIRMMMDAHTRLTDIGWKDVIYCPKDGTVFEVIEPGSIGIFKCQYEGEWPKGTWWILGDGDMFPARPVLFRPIVAATSGEGEG